MPSLVRVVVIVIGMTMLVGMFRPIVMLVRLLRVVVLMIVIAMPVFVCVLNSIGMLVCVRVFVILHCVVPLTALERDALPGVKFTPGP